MENKNPTSHIVKGAIIASIGILISIIVHVFNLYESQWINWVTYVLIIGGLVYGAIMFSNQNNHNVTFGNVFAHSFKTTAVVIVIQTLYTLLAIKVLFPEMLDKVLEISRKKMEENPKMTDELIEQAMTMTRKYFVPFAIGGSIIGTAFIGLIGSLLGAAFAKKNANPFNESEN
jgi:H+/Cl- antiporter ClcA